MSLVDRFKKSVKQEDASRASSTTLMGTGANTPAATSGQATPVFEGSISPDPEKKDELNDHPYMTWKTGVMGLVVSIGGLMFGYDTGQISGFLAMDEFLEHFGQFNETTGMYYFSNVRSGLLVGMLNIGNLCGALLAAPLADRVGRKPSITAWALIYTVGVIVQISALEHWYQVVIGRWAGGLGVGALSVLVPLYLSETAPTHNRGTITCLYQLFVTLGILFANIINFGTEGIHSTAAWRITMGIDFLWALCLGVGMLFFPESPKHEYRKGNQLGAAHTMSRLLGTDVGHPIVTKEIGEMKEKLDAENAGGKPAWYEIFTGPRMLYRTLLGISIMSFQQLTGANFFFYYGTTVFAATGLSNSYVTQIILGTVNVFCTFPGLYFAAKFSRRKCLYWGALWMCGCFLVFASIGHFALDQDEPTNTPKAGSAMIVFACLFIASFASTWGPLSWGESAALYPARYRATSMAVATSANWIFNFLLAFFTPFITSAIDYRYGYVFAGCCLAMAATTYFFMIESQGRTLEELDTAYIMHVKPWKSIGWQPPQGEELINVDRMYLNTGGRGLSKSEQGGRGGEERVEQAPEKQDNAEKVERKEGESPDAITTA